MIIHITCPIPILIPRIPESEDQHGNAEISIEQDLSRGGKKPSILLSLHPSATNTNDRYLGI